MKTFTKAVLGISVAGAAYLLSRKNNDVISVESPAKIHGFVRNGF